MIEKIITGRLKALTGLHIGSGDLTETTDSPVFRNSDGAIIIPGTAIAGSLRSLATRLASHFGFKECIALDENSSSKFCNCPVCNLFGSINSGKNSNEGTASKIWMSDAILENDSKTSIRDGVGIDRETRTSSRAAQAKYDLEVIPKDSVFSFKLAIEGGVTEEQEKILSCALAEWRKGRGYLGGNVARGLGNIQLIEIKVFSINLSSIENLMAFLKEDDPTKVADEEKGWLEVKTNSGRSLIKCSTNNEYLYNSFVQLDFTLKFTGGFVINDVLKAVQSGFDFCPRMENGNFVLPGSSLRGVIRSHAEKIARSLATLNSKNAYDFLMKCPACNPFAGKETPLTSCNILLREHKRKHKDEEIKDEQMCLACQFFGSSYKGSKMYVGDGYLIDSPKIKIMDFLAIDRFTGGVREGAKFDALVLWQPSFKVRIFIENPKEWQLGLLMLVLKDLKDGLISVGFGENKWLGKVIVENEAIKVGAISKDFIPSGLKISSSYEGIFNTQILKIDSISEPIELWVREFHNILSNFRRENNLVPTSDTYFKDDIPNLYPKEVGI